MEEAHVALHGHQEHIEIGQNHARLCQEPLSQSEVPRGIAAQHQPVEVQQRRHCHRHQGQHQEPGIQGHQRAPDTPPALEAKHKELHQQCQHRKQRTVLLAEQRQRKTCAESGPQQPARSTLSVTVAKPGSGIAHEARQHEQGRELRHALHGVQHRADLKRMQHPGAGHHQCRPPRLPRSAGPHALEQPAREHESQAGVDQMNEQVGELPAPHHIVRDHPAQPEAQP